MTMGECCNTADLTVLCSFAAFAVPIKQKQFQFVENHLKVF